MGLIKECVKFAASIPMEWTNPAKTPDANKGDRRVLDDSHVHYPFPKGLYDLDYTLEQIISKLDRSAITHWGNNVKGVLTYDDVTDILINCQRKSRVSIEFNGPVSTISFQGRKTEVYNSQEIRTGSHLHISAEGCKENIPEGLDPRKTVELIHEAKGLAIVEHPTTKCHPLKQYTTTTFEEDKLTREVFEMADAAEVFNSYNTLWMAASNAKAKALVAYHNCHSRDLISPIAASDLHYGLNGPWTKSFFFNHLGKNGIYLPKRENSSLTGEEIIEQKRQDLVLQKYDVLENYAGPATFFMTMVPPIIARKLDINKDSIS